MWCIKSKSLFGLLRLRQGLWTILLGCLLTASNAADEPSAEDLTFFEKRVRPILVQRCFECHVTGSDKPHGGLQLDHRDGLIQGGDSGAAVELSNPTKSLLLEAIGYNSEQLQMPPTGKLPDNEITILTEWIHRGLPFPSPSGTPVARGSLDVVAAKSHWSFRRLAMLDPPPPPIELANWPRTRIDHFVLAGQVAHGLRPAAVAPRETLIRRLKVDLLGLPPTLEEVQEFLHDPATDAYERLVDRYLAAPQYGERWSRHWLDLARYCDVTESWREGHGQPWLYRDWVVAAFNHDLPYDAFVRQQLAADLMPDAKPTDNTALGFLGLSPTYWKELKLDHWMIKQVVAEEWEERIEAIGGTFLGLTLACARCHDHKFDPVTQRDYYALAGVLASIKLDDRSLLPADQAANVRQARIRIQAIEKEIGVLTAQKPVAEENQLQADTLQRQIDEIRRAAPGIDKPEAMGVVEASLHVLPDGPSRTKLEYHVDEPRDVALHIRGNAAKPGAEVPRGFPAVLASTGSKLFQRGSGRLELADAIVTDAAPLAARVWVNRIWKYHFGRGLVTTLSNFGIQGDLPSHPELLDDLAARFLEHGWSLKWLHREILLSATFQQSSLAAESRQQDPDNIWLARMPIRRLEVEAWRDAMLTASGELDLRTGGAAQDLSDLQNRRRTLYGTVKRRELSDWLRLHDFPDPVSHAASRVPTTTPLQQLFVLNGPFMAERSRQLLGRLRAENANSTSERIQLLYATVFARKSNLSEVEAIETFLSDSAAAGVAEDEAWIQLVQALLGSNELLFVE